MNLAKNPLTCVLLALLWHPDLLHKTVADLGFSPGGGADSQSGCAN